MSSILSDTTREKWYDSILEMNVEQLRNELLISLLSNQISKESAKTDQSESDKKENIKEAEKIPILIKDNKQENSLPEVEKQKSTVIPNDKEDIIQVESHPICIEEKKNKEEEVLRPKKSYQKIGKMTFFLNEHGEIQFAFDTLLINQIRSNPDGGLVITSASEGGHVELVLRKQDKEEFSSLILASFKEEQKK